MAGASIDSAGRRCTEAATRRGWLEIHTGRAVFIGLALIVLMYVLSGIWLDSGQLVDAAVPLGLNRSFRLNLILLALTALTAWANLRDPGIAAGYLRELRASIALDDAEFAALISRLRAPGRVATTAMGVVLGSAMFAISNRLIHGGWTDWPFDFHFLWSSPITVCLFVLLCLGGVRTLHVARLYSEVGDHHMRIRLLDARALQPFARYGLSTAYYWFIGSALAVPLTFNGLEPLLIVGVVPVTLAIGIATLVHPCLGVHRALRRAKESELERVQQLIEARSAALFDSTATVEAEPLLPSLLAYERRISEVSEWPFDTPNLLRLALFLLIPVGSWLGGAFVERLVDSVLS